MVRRKLRGLGKRNIILDFNLYRVQIPIKGTQDSFLSVIDICPEHPKKTLVLIHGFAGCAETWEYQINHLVQNYHVIIPDLRGHGQSDAPYTDYTMDEIVEDLHNNLEFLGISEKFVLIGHSFGGSICTEYAVRYPEQLEKLILISTAGEYPLPGGANFISKFPTKIIQPIWRYRPKWNAEVHVLKRMAMNNMKVWKGWDLFKRIKTSTLIITGARDKYFPRWAFENVYEAIPGAEVYDIGASKHKVQLERHNAVNRAIERFIWKEKGSVPASWRENGPFVTQKEHRPWLSMYSKNSPYNVPIPSRTLPEYLAMTAYWVPKRIATVFYGKKMTYSDLHNQVMRFGKVLQDFGIQKGDRVMIILPNMPQLIVAYYATLLIGGVVVLPNPDADGPAILHQLLRTQAKILITLDAFQDLEKIIQAQLDIKVIYTNIKNAVTSDVYSELIARWETAGLKADLDVKKGKDINYMNDLIKKANFEQLEDIKILPSQIAAILFTTGTTGEPKGVTLSHKNLVANALQTRHWIPNLTWGKEIFLTIIPLTHSYGMTIGMNIPILIGSTIILLSVFEMKQVLKSIKKDKPTVFPGVPSIYSAINHLPKVRTFGLSSIKACVSGAAPLPIEVKESFEKLSHGSVVEGYGLTEASPVTHVNPIGGIPKVGSIGVPIANTDAKIVDIHTGEVKTPNQIGELLVKGPQVMMGYWNQDGTLDKKGVLDDGWLHTGDVAVMDEEGFFKIIARKRDTILAGEYSVYPRDVEEVLYENSNVMEAAVVGVEYVEGKQRIKACVVPRPGTLLTKEELLELCRRRLNEYAVPWEIEFRKELPKSFVGKVLRRMLTE